MAIADLSSKIAKMELGIGNTVRLILFLVIWFKEVP